MEFAVAVNSLGEITDIKLCYPRNALSLGLSMLDAFTEESGLQVLQMLRNASSIGEYAHQQLYLRQERNPVTVHVLAGCDELLVIGFGQEHSADGLVRIYNEVMNRLRVDFKRAVQLSEQSVREQFEQVQALNNDLTNSQRLLAKANDKLQRQFRFEKLLSDIAARLARCDLHTRPTVIEESLSLWGQFFGADHLYLCPILQDKPSGVATVQWTASGVPPLTREDQQKCACDAWLYAALGGGEPLAISSLASLPPESGAVAELWQSHGMQSLLFVPFMESNTLAGYICLSFVRKQYHWLETDISCCRIIAEVVGHAVSKQITEERLAQSTEQIASLYGELDQEIHRARTVHQRNLPALQPTMGSVSVYPYYAPAAHLGGDLYFAAQVDNCLVICLSDVTGHGLEGALFSVFIKEAIDSYITLRPWDLGPKQILQHLDRQYRRENYPEDYFISIFVAVADLDDGTLRYSGAGFQNLPLLIGADGVRHTLCVEGLPITSVVPVQLMEFPVQEVQFEPGTTLLLFTDGLVEQTSDGVRYEERLAEVFYGHSHLSAAMIGETIVKDFHGFGGGEQNSDDITFLVLQMN